MEGRRGVEVPSWSCSNEEDRVVRTRLKRRRESGSEGWRLWSMVTVSSMI